MKRPPFLIVVVLLMLSLLACEFAGITVDLGGGEETDEKVSVEAGIDSPPNGASLKMAPVDIAYHANSLDGISAVELSVNGEVVNSFSSPASDQQVIALKYIWQPTAPGSHTIRVRAQSSTGLWSDFVAAAVTIEGEVKEQPTAQLPQAESTPQQGAPPPQPSETPKEPTIFDIKHDKEKFFYGSSSCGSREITITAKLTHPEKAAAVVLFTRFYDKEGEGVTKWDSGRSMKKISSDSYTATLISNQITNYNTFEYTIMNYQLVVQDKAGNYTPKSEVIKVVTLEICP